MRLSAWPPFVEVGAPSTHRRLPEYHSDGWFGRWLDRRRERRRLKECRAAGLTVGTVRVCDHGDCPVGWCDVEWLMRMSD